MTEQDAAPDAEEYLAVFVDVLWHVIFPSAAQVSFSFDTNREGGDCGRVQRDA